MPEAMREKSGQVDDVAASLFDEYAKDLHRYVRNNVSSLADVDDVFQTVFERLVKVKRMDRVQEPHKYLFGIASHVIREFWFKQRRGSMVRIDSRAVEKADESLEHAEDDAADRLNLHRQLEDALAALSDNQRRVLLAVKRDGMSHEEAAAATGISVHMVRKLLVEAKARMMEMTWDR
jgi:RNA polymerase sigma factor (sigma-70 family)